MNQLLRTAGASASVAHARNGISACAKGDRPPPLSGYGPVRILREYNVNSPYMRKLQIQCTVGARGVPRPDGLGTIEHSARPYDVAVWNVIDYVITEVEKERLLCCRVHEDRPSFYVAFTPPILRYRDDSSDKPGTCTSIRTSLALVISSANIAISQVLCHFLVL